MTPLRPAFTLMEVLLVLAIMGVLVGAAVPFFGTFHHRQARSALRDDVGATLQRAQQRALQSERGDHWGVAFHSGSFTLFKGATYAGRDATFDELHQARGFGWSGRGDIIFRRAHGTPFTGGTITFTHAVAGKGEITINPAGAIFRR